MFIENGTDPGSKQLHGHSYRWGLMWIDWKPLCLTKKFLKVVFIPVSHRKSTSFFFFGCKNSMCCHWGHGVSAQTIDFYGCWLYEIFSTIHRKDLKYVKLISFLFFLSSERFYCLDHWTGGNEFYSPQPLSLPTSHCPSHCPSLKLQQVNRIRINESLKVF